MAKQTITSGEFLQQLVENNISDPAKAEEIMAKMQADWIEVLWGDELLQSAKQVVNMTPQQDNGVSGAWYAAGAIGWWAATLSAPFVWKKIIKNMLWPSEKEIGDMVHRVSKYLVGAGGNMKPELKDETTKSVFKLLGNIPKTKEKIDSRFLYNYIGDVKNWAFNEKENVKSLAADRKIHIDDALAPLAKQIQELQGKDYNKADKLQKMYDEAAANFDSNGEIDIKNAEEIKKYHASEFKWYDSAGKIWATPEANAAGLGNKKIAEWFRSSIEKVVPELKPYNVTYWAAKDIEAWIGNMANKVWTQMMSTPWRVASTKVSNVVKSVPWVATAGKVLTSLPDAAYEERKIPWIVKTASKYLPEIEKFIETAASKGKWIWNTVKPVVKPVVQPVAKALWSAGKTIWKALPVVGWALSLWLAANEIMGGTQKVAAGKVLTSLPDAAYEERKIPWIVKTASKYLPEIEKFIETAASKGKWIWNTVKPVVKPVAKALWSAGKTIWKALPVVGWALSLWLAANEIMGGTQKVAAGNVAPVSPKDQFAQKYNAATQPKTWPATIAPSQQKFSVNPEAQIFKGWTLAWTANPNTVYAVPWIGAAIGGIDMLSEWLKKWEELVRAGINKLWAPKKKKLGWAWD